MRYFLELSYNGTSFCGWQRQPNAPSVQQTIEEELSKLLGSTTDIVGCGRTDTGVHAKQYFLHFDTENEVPQNIVFRLNKMLPTSIAIQNCFEVVSEKHARFNASNRAYEYHIIFEKSPFEVETAWCYHLGKKLDLKKLQAAAQLLLEYKDFFPFCKTNTDVKTMRCDLRRSEWEQTGKGLIYHIAADRFLRGMVRLIVGMCINVGLGKVELATVKEALDNQTRLTKSYSVPPQGLYLTDVQY